MLASRPHVHVLLGHTKLVKGHVCTLQVWLACADAVELVPGKIVEVASADTVELVPGKIVEVAGKYKVMKSVVVVYVELFV